MKNIRLLAFIVPSLLLLSVHARAETFKVIVNPGVHMPAMPKKMVSDLFMKRLTKWDGGMNVVVVDQAEQTAVRDEFSRAILGKPTAAVKSYWNQQIFSGREVPPLEKQGDNDVLAFVRSTPGAVGYVSEATPTDGVRVVQVQ